MGEIDRAHAEWRSKLTQPAWIATTSNYYRPLSVEGALCKGSRGIFAPEISRYLTSLFPDFHCALGQKELTGVESSSVGFVRLPTESLAGSIKRVEDYFSVSLGMHDCQEIASPGTFLAYCLPQTSGAVIGDPARSRRGYFGCNSSARGGVPIAAAREAETQGRTTAIADHSAGDGESRCRLRRRRPNAIAGRSTTT
jgi:hypothetical protein